jgi:hypothetical protein
MISDHRKRKGYKRKSARTTWQPVGQGVLMLPKPQTLIQKRLIDTAEALTDAPEEIAYQHSILCQTGLPARSNETLRFDT